MKSIDSYLLKSAPKEIAAAIAAKDKAFFDAIESIGTVMQTAYSIKLKSCEKELQRLAEKYGAFDQNGVML